MASRNRGPRLGRARLPRSCPINFDFSVDRIECKTCRYFETCLRVYNMARRIAGRGK